MRISWLSVSDQLGDASRAVSMIGGLRACAPVGSARSCCPATALQLRERVEAAARLSVVVPMPPSLARVGESAAIRERWGAGATVALGLRLCASACALPAYESRLDARCRPSSRTSSIRTASRPTSSARAPPAAPRRGVAPARIRLAATGDAVVLRRYAGPVRAIVANSRAWPPTSPRFRDAPARARRPQRRRSERFYPGGPALDLDGLAALPAGAASVRASGSSRRSPLERARDVSRRVAAAFGGGGRSGATSSAALCTTRTAASTRSASLSAMVDARGLRGRVGSTGFVDSGRRCARSTSSCYASTSPNRSAW